jgi:putative phosphonate metabolism protein
MPRDTAPGAALNAKRSHGLESGPAIHGAARYAVYFAPPPGGDWWTFGCHWLGRDALTGEALAPAAVAGVTPAALREMTQDARQYGFHATLKPPFLLAPRKDVNDLYQAVAALANAQAPFSLGLVAARTLDGFVALMPEQRNDALHDLARQCVEALDPFRAPAGPEDLSRRRAKGLTPRQEALLQRWGYPYVMDEWRFHMTLTRLIPRVERLNSSPLQVDALCVFMQPARSEPFRLVRRCGFDGSVTDYA